MRVTLTVSVTHPRGVECDHQLARFEDVDDVFDQFHVVLNKPVGFEADIAEGNLRGDVDSCVFPQTSRAILLDQHKSLILSSNSHIFLHH